MCLLVRGHGDGPLHDIHRSPWMEIRGLQSAQDLVVVNGVMLTIEWIGFQGARFGQHFHDTADHVLQMHMPCRGASVLQPKMGVFSWCFPGYLP